MPTLREQNEKLVLLKHRLGVWEAVRDFLDTEFVSKDTGRPAKKAVKVEDCLVEVVPEETVETIIQEIGEGPISDLRAQINTIENQEVVLGKAEK